MQLLKERYFNTKGRTNKIQGLILKHKISTEWLYQYLLKKNKGISSKFPLIADKCRLDTLIFELGLVLGEKFNEQILSAAKAWSVKNTRQRSSLKNKPISFSQKDYALLKSIAINRKMTEKELIVSLLKDEEKRIEVYGTCKKTSKTLV